MSVWGGYRLSRPWWWLLRRWARRIGR